MALWLLHRWLTVDALTGIIPDARTLKRIARQVEMADISFRHGKYSCHRVGKYQEEFERYGLGWAGKPNRFPGAEEQAVKFFSLAAVSTGDEREKNLGYAIHHIQDALCPEHVFPFQENRFDKRLFAPHLMYSIYVAIGYRKHWSEIVRQAPTIGISSPEDLRIKIEEAADWVRGFPCSYVREDGFRVIDPLAGEVPWTGWRMSPGYTGGWLERASGLIKGEVLYITAKFDEFGGFFIAFCDNF